VTLYRPTSPGGDGAHTKQSTPHADSKPSCNAQPKAQAKPDKVVLSGSAKKQLNVLGLNEKQRQEVESGHNFPGGDGAHGTEQSAPHTSSNPSNNAQPKAQAKPDKVVFSGSAKKQLNVLGAGLNEKQRQEVESGHTKAVQREMDPIGADHAKIR